MVIIRDAIKSILKYLSKSNAGDPDRRWSVRYTTQKPLHGLLFLPPTSRGSDESSSPEPVLSLNQPNGPVPFSSDPRIRQSERSQGFEWRRWSRKMSSVDSDDDERLVAGGTRPMTPLVLTSCWEGPASFEEGGISCGLPTPEEVTRRHAQTVMADIVPINITGESFDRQASVHRSLSQRDALNRRPSFNRWTRPGLDQDCSQARGETWTGPAKDLKLIGPDLTQSSAHNPSRTPDQDRDLSPDQKKRTETRRIRAPRGDLPILMDTLTSSKRLNSQDAPPSTSCLQSPDSATYRAIYYSPADTQSDCQSLCSSVLEPWRYQALSRSTSLHSAQDSGSVGGESWSCEPLLCSGSPSRQSLRSESSSVYSHLQNCSQTSLDLEESSLCFGQTSGQNTVSSSIHFHPSSSPSYDSLCSESTSSISQMSLNIEEKLYSNSNQILNQNTEKMEASSSLNSIQTSPSHSSLRSESPSNLYLNLDRSCSQSQTSLSSSARVSSAKRRNVSSGASLSRRISLKKSRRPPAPPLRNESLKRRPKPPRPSLEKRRAEERRSAEGSTPSLENERVASPIPAQFGDPWVPRMKRRQSGLNCGTTTTFEPREEEEQNTTTTTQAFCELQRLTSSSSGYSSQSNTPLSSPVSPSSPPLKSQLQEFFVSRPKFGPKPRPPERTTSLLSSLSSSSSLSSCASSEASIKNMQVPPPPPPLPVYNQQLPVISHNVDAASSNAPIPNPVILSRSHPPPTPPSPPPLPPSFPLPPSSPLPVLNHTRPACSRQICTYPLKAANLHNSTALEDSTVPLSSLPSPPLLPSRSSLPPPPPLPPSPQRLLVTRTIRDTPQLPQILCQATHSSPPSPPPLPLQLSKPPPPLFPESFAESKKSPKMSLLKTSTPCSPLVTTQALKNVKLRSVKSQEFTRTNSLPTMDAAKTENTNTDLELLRKKANSTAYLNETPGLQDTTFSKHEGSNPTRNISKSDVEISDGSEMHLSANQASCEFSNGENIKLSKDLSSAESRLQEQHNGKIEEDSKNLVFNPNVTEEKSGSELPEESKVCEEVYDGANSEGNVLNNTCMQVVARQKAMNGTKNDVSNLDECWKDAEMNQEISLDQIETVLRDLDASMEDSEGETIRQSRDITSTTSRGMIDDAQGFYVTEKGLSFDCRSLKSENVFTDQSSSDGQEMNKVSLEEKGQKTVAAEICSSGLKVQNAQITNVKQYKLQTTENYFNIQDEQNLQNLSEDLEIFSKNSVFKGRNQAYMDMYAMLAESTATRLNNEEDLGENLYPDKNNAQKKRKKPKRRSKYTYYDVNEREASEFSDRATGLKSLETFEEGNVFVLDKPWVKMETVSKECEESNAEESQYWSLCGGDDDELQKGEEKDQSLSSSKTDQLSPTKTRSPIKPALPKKPDLGILGILNRTANLEHSVEKMLPENEQKTSPNQNSNSARREKPPILHKKPDLATRTQSSSSKPELVWRNIEDSTEVWSVRKLENDSTMSKITTLDNCDSSVEMGGIFSTESHRNPLSHKDGVDVEAFLEGSAMGFHGFTQNYSTNFSWKTKEHVAKEETARNTFVDTSTSSKMCTLGKGDRVWSPGQCNNDAVWECLEANAQDKVGAIAKFENDQNSWMENLENLGSYKNRATNVQNLSENIWCPRNPESECVLTDREKGLTDFCAMENNKSHKVPSEQEEVQIRPKSGDFETDLSDFQKCAGGKTQMNKTQQMNQNQKLFMQRKRERFLFSSSSSSSSLSSSENEPETFENAVLSEQSRRVIGQSCLSLSSALSTDSLKGELSLPDLLIKEPEEEENDVFGGVSAEQFTVPAQTRSTDDLFAIIHRSKRKMFGRKDSGVFSTSSFSSSFSSSLPSRPMTPSDPCPAPKGQRSQHSDGFKALLLKKGVHLGSTPHASAVERLCGPPPLQHCTSYLTQRPLTPPCYTGRWFSPWTRLQTAPMAAILEHHGEEDQPDDDEVFEHKQVLF